MRVGEEAPPLFHTRKVDEMNVNDTGEANYDSERFDSVPHRNRWDRIPASDREIQPSACSYLCTCYRDSRCDEFVCAVPASLYRYRVVAVLLSFGATAYIAGSVIVHTVI